MLPVESHATSVGRLKFSPAAPRSRRRPRRPPPARPRAAAAPRLHRPAAPAVAAPTERVGVGRHGQRQVRHPHRLGLAAEDHLDPPVRVELDHLRRHLIDHPDVVLRIDADLLRLQEAVDALADLTDELAGAIELEQPRAAVRDVARAGGRDHGRAGPRVDEDVALRVGRHAGRFAEVHVRAAASAASDASYGISGKFSCADSDAAERERCRERARPARKRLMESSLTGSTSSWSGAGGSSARATR